MFKSKKLLNRIMVLILVVMITFLVVDSDVKQAYASPVPNPAWIPIVIEGGKMTAEGVVATTGGMTVGGALAIGFSLIAVGVGIYLVVDNWTEITTAIADLFDNDERMIAWWNDIASKAIYIYDSDRTLASDLTNGIAINLFNYALPDGSEVTMPSQFNDFIKEFIQDYYGYDILAPGTGTNVNKVISDLFRVYGVSSIGADMSFLNYSNIIINKAGNGFNIMVSNSPLNIVLTSNSTYFWYHVTGTNVTIYYYQTKSFTSKETHSAFPGDTGGEYTLSNRHVFSMLPPAFSHLDKLLFNNNPITFSSGSASFLVPSMVIEYTIPPSDYHWNDSGQYIDNAIRINQQTIKQLKDDNLVDIFDTDRLVQKVKEADTRARTNNTEILDKAVVPKGDPIPVDTDPSPNPNPNPDPSQWYDIILNPLKEFARWLFVPDSVVINQLVNDIQNKMDQQAGLLTYPLTLVIRFLMEVYQLDVTDCILHIPKMEIFGYEFYEGCYYNLTQEIHKSDYALIYSVYMYFTDFILIIGFISLCIKKGDEMMKGGISPT